MPDSDPTVPIPASAMRAALAAEGAEPVPDDDTPTQPDLRPEACPRCEGSRKALLETATGYRGPVPCPLCTPREDA